MAGMAAHHLALVQLDVCHRDVLESAYGRPAFAALSRRLAERLIGSLRATDRVAVPAAGSIVLMIGDAADREAVAAVVERLLAALEAAFEVDGRPVELRVTVAAALVDEDAVAEGGLWLALESAASSAREIEPGVVAWPSAACTATLDGCRRRRVELLEAAESSRFFPVFQPQLDLETGRFARVEVLMRWRRRDGTTAGPAEFLQDLRNLGRLAEVSASVYAAAFAQLRRWLGAGIDIQRIALNLDVSQVRGEDWAESLLAVVAASGVAPERVEFEISEHILEAAAIDGLATGLQRLRDAGVAISLDDFGAGYGSLTQLARLPVDLVKLDARLLWDAETNPRTRTLMQGVVALTAMLGLPCVFEGVETAGQLDLARVMGARLAQGYHLGRPASATQIEAALGQPFPLALPLRPASPPGDGVSGCASRRKFSVNVH